MLFDLRRLDIYRKIPKDLTQPTYAGACISVLCCLFMTYLFVAELISFLSVEIISEMYVADESSDERIPVDIDIIILNMDCKYLGLDIQDNMGRHEVGFVDNVNRVPYNNGQGCQFIAKFKVNKVPGNFHISTHSSRDQPTDAEMAHVIQAVTFGDTFVHNMKLPGSFNPLSGRTQNGTNPQSSFEYFLKVVPTIVEEYSGAPLLHAHQYTYAHREHVQYGHGAVQPVIWFRYDLSPITVKYTKKYKPLYSFLTTVCAIVGGTFTVAGIIDSMLFTAAGIFKKAELGKLS
jgi:hypothetical protein